MSRIFDCCRGDVLKMFKTGYSMKIFQGRNGTGAVGSSEDKGKEEGNLLMVCQFYAWAAISRWFLRPSAYSDCSLSLYRRMGNES